MRGKNFNVLGPDLGSNTDTDLHVTAGGGHAARSKRTRMHWLMLSSSVLLWHCSSTPTGTTPAANSGGMIATVMSGNLAPSPVSNPAGTGSTAIAPQAGTLASAGRAAMTPVGTAGQASLPRAGSSGRAAAIGGMSAMSTAGISGKPAAGSGSPPGTPVPMRAAKPSPGCGMADAPASGNMMIDVDGTQREYIVKVPTGYDPSKPYRLIFAWHGLGGTAMQIASNFAGYYGLATRSANSAIFIAPQGLPTSTGGTAGASGSGAAAGDAGWPNTGGRDIAFTRKMLDWAKSKYCVDLNRIFSVGMSYGGIMSNTVGCELGDSFRAIAPMSGSGPRQFGSKMCVGQVAVWMSHGNMDTTVPFSQGQASRDYWVKANHCGADTQPVMPGTCLAYQGCDAEFPVHFCEFDGGHMVPSFASEAIWNFLSQF